MKRNNRVKWNIRALLAVLLSAAMLIGGLTGCARGTDSPPGGDVTSQEQSSAQNTESKTGTPEAYMIDTKNYFDYQSGMECSAFASAFVLRHFGEEADGMALFETYPQKAADGGVMPSGLVTFFKQRGFEAEYRTDGTVEELKAQISKGTPVIVFIHVAEPYDNPHYTHYVPLVGYDEEYFYFAESLSDYANCKEETGVPYNRKTEIDKFERLWDNIDGVWDNPYFVIEKKS